MHDLMYRATIRAHTAGAMAADDLKVGLARRLDVRDERGDVTPRTVGIAIMTAAAVAVGAAITLKITNKETAISLD